MMAAAQSPATAPLCLQYIEAVAAMPHLPTAFLLKTGRAWHPAKLPPMVTRGRPKQCYQTAGLLALESPDLTYVEGYACPSGLIPVHHGWCITSAGVVVDPTFEDPEESQYYGVALSTGFLRKTCSESSCWGIFAGLMTPNLFLDSLDDIQAGPWAVPLAVEVEIREMLRPHLRSQASPSKARNFK